jgi:hypothetical protein
MKRGRNQRRRQGMNINRALDSNGPDVRIRGTANQIYDKYLALARDANSAGDRVKAENYLQHAEHYFRVIRAMQPQMPTHQLNGDQPELDGESPGAGEGGDRRFNRDQPRYDQPQPGYGGEDGEFDGGDQPESRFDAHPFAEERQGDENRRPDYQGQHRQDNRGDHRNDRRGDHRRDHRPDQRNDHRNDHRNDQRRHDQPRPEQHRRPEPSEVRAEEAAAEAAPESRAEAPRGEGDARFDNNDRRGRRRRRPRPPLGAEGASAGGAEEGAAGEGGEMAPETV